MRQNLEDSRSGATLSSVRALLEADPEWHDGEIVYAESPETS